MIDIFIHIHSNFSVKCLMVTYKINPPSLLKIYIASHIYSKKAKRN